MKKVDFFQSLQHPLVGGKSDVVGYLRIVTDIDQIKHFGVSLEIPPAGRSDPAHVVFAPHAGAVALQLLQERAVVGGMAQRREALGPELREPVGRVAARVGAHGDAHVLHVERVERGDTPSAHLAFGRVPVRHRALDSFVCL